MTRRGFTLLEVLLVVVVIVLLGAMAYPSIEVMYADVRLNAAADQIRGRWAEARTKAIEDGRPYRFAVQPGGQYRIAPDSADFWDGGASDAPADSDAPPLEVEESLPAGVGFADGGTAADGDSGGWQTIVTFLPDGTASRDVEVIFQSDAARRPLHLKLRGLTGSVTVQMGAAGGHP